MGEWNGMERRKDCGGCSVTDVINAILTEKEKSDTVKRDMNRSNRNIILGVITICVGVLSTSQYFSMDTLSSRMEQISKGLGEVNKTLSNQAESGARLEQAFTNYVTVSTKEREYIKSQLYEWQWVTEAMWKTLPKELRIKLAEGFVNNKQEKGK